MCVFVRVCACVYDELYIKIFKSGYTIWALTILTGRGSMFFMI